MGKNLNQGAIAGIIAGTLKDIPDAFFHNVLQLTNITFWDYAGNIALGHHPKDVGEIVLSFFFEMVFSILVGIIFSFALDCFKPKHYLWWGAYYGALVWFTVRAAVLGFHINSLLDGQIVTSTINSFNSVIYGIILSYIIHYLSEKKQI